jgi:hypothetical protein
MSFIICTLPQIFYGDQIKEDGLGERVDGRLILKWILHMCTCRLDLAVSRCELCGHGNEPSCCRNSGYPVYHGVSRRRRHNKCVSTQFESRAVLDVPLQGVPVRIPLESWIYICVFLFMADPLTKNWFQIHDAQKYGRLNRYLKVVRLVEEVHYF